MAQRYATAETSPGVQISPERLDNLLASKAFHEVALNIIEILQDSSRFAYYRSSPQNENLRDNGYYRSHDKGVSQSKDQENADQSSERKVYSERDHPLPFKIPPERAFDVENVKARKAYERKRQRSMEMYARASVSYLAAQYDFQYKFYSDDTYAQIERSKKIAGIDPWAWARSVPDSADIEAYDARNQLDHGARLQEMVLHRKSELMEALFPLRTTHVLQCMSWPELEHSYGLHLRDIVNRLGYSKCDNVIGYTDSDITLVIIEVGRFFTEIDYSNRPIDLHKGDIQDIVGPFAGGLWFEGIRKKFTLDELHRRCHEKGLIKDWEGNKVLRIVIDGFSGVGTTERQAGMLYILEAIFTINKARRKNWPMRRPISDEESRMFILDFLEMFVVPDVEDALEQSNDQVFAAHDLNIKALKSLGGLRIIWTDSVDDHLRLCTASRTLSLFWDVSLLDQSLLFWYNAQPLRNFAASMDSPTPQAITKPVSHALNEVSSTYRLLFHNADAKHYTTTETCAVANANIGQGIMVNDLRVDIGSSRARKILKTFLEAPVPSKLGRVREVKKSTLLDHLKSGPPYTLDFCWHIENMLSPSALVGEGDATRSFNHFPRFGSRLRQLKLYMDNQKPSGWYQMWKDKRDRVQHVTFWAVLVFGTISIVLALISIATGREKRQPGKERAKP